MVLKRLLVTTLGALGLGALAAGPASAQQVPAPDLFDGQVACSSNVPAGMADGLLATALAEAVMDGEPIDEDADADTTTYTGDLAGLNYIIPPGNSNCGGGTFNHDVADDADGTATPNIPVPVTGAIATDVATGYTETLKAYLAVRDADDAVEAARKLLKSSPDNEDFQGDLTDALTAQAEAHSNLYARGAGPINTLGIAEWRAKFAVEDAVTAWNNAVGEFETAGDDTSLLGLRYGDGDVSDHSGDKYVQLTNTEQLLSLVDATTGNVNTH